MVEVVKGVGIYGPSELVREILNQAEGRPGLAVTLTRLCIQGDLLQVFAGDALSRSLLGFFNRAVGEQASQILAAFSVGGDAGLSMLSVAAALGLPLAEVQTAMVKLAAGGVVLDKGEQFLSVRPPALRHSLVRNVFFKGSLSLPIDALMANAPSLRDVASTLCGAKARGASVPPHLLIGLVESTRIWDEYASLGPEEARWLVAHHPDVVPSCGDTVLASAPEAALPVLLSAAVGDDRPLNSTPEHPLREIEEWAKDLLSLGNEASRRRELLLDAAEKWLGGGGDTKNGVRVLQYVFDPDFEARDSDPGAGMTLYFTRGVLPLEELERLWSLWPRLVRLLSHAYVKDWEPVTLIIENWALLGRFSMSKVPDGAYAFARSCARQMIRDVGEAAKGRSGILHWLNGMAAELGLDLRFPVDESFEALHPNRGRAKSGEPWEEGYGKVIAALADAWKGRAPADAVRQLAFFEEEAASARGGGTADYTFFFCRELASLVESPLGWAVAAPDGGLTERSSLPFLDEAARRNEPGWAATALVYLENASLRRAAVTIALTLPSAPDELVDAAFARLGEFSDEVERLCLFEDVPADVVERLLIYEDRAVSAAAVEGLWRSKLRGKIDEGYKALWQRAFCRNARHDSDHFIKEALERDPRLARPWLSGLFLERDPQLYRYRSALPAALGALNLEEKEALLREVPDSASFGTLVPQVMGDDLDLYVALLEHPRLKGSHLLPLCGKPKGSWFAKALAALDAGYSPEEVAHATRGFPQTMIGSRTRYWREWIESFARLEAHEDERIRRVGEIGRERAESRLNEVLDEEKHSAIYGSP